MKPMPLQGIRVLDMGRILAAPLAGQALGDLGAEVIKVERPGAGDEARRWGPPFLKDPAGNDTRESPMYLSANRNKRSVTIDISRPEGQALIKQLAAQCDVLIENYKVGDLQRYGLDYESMKVVNPRLIYCSITGFGQDGPYSSQPGYDTVFQAMSGMMSVTGLPDGVPGGGPMKTGPSLADFIAGQYAVSAIVAALFGRERADREGRGEGQYIDIALMDCTIAAQSHYIATYLATGTVPPRRGTEGNGGLPSQAFMCKDRGIIVICGSEAQYRDFCEVLDHPELADDPRFRTNAQRLQHRQELAATFGTITLQHQSDELLARLRAAGIPCGPINAYPEVFSNPQVLHRDLVLDLPHATAGRVRLLDSPMRFAGRKPQTSLAPPVVGQHTEMILSEFLSLDADRIAALRESKVI